MHSATNVAERQNTFRVLYAVSPEGWYELNLDNGVGQGYQIIQQITGASNGGLTLLVKRMAEGCVPSVILSSNIIEGTDGGQLGQWMRRVVPFVIEHAEPCKAPTTQSIKRLPNQGQRPSKHHSIVPIVQNPKQFAVPIQMGAPLQTPNSIQLVAMHQPPYHNKFHKRQLPEQHKPTKRPMQARPSKPSMDTPRCKIVI